MKLPDTESTKSILFVFMLYFIIFLLVYGFFSIRWRSEGCPETVLNQTTSPNGAWVASITQSRCGNDIWPTILGEVDLVRSDGSGERTTILGVDTGGNASEYPRATWSGSASLKIIVPSSLYLKVLHRMVPGVAIDIELESRNPREQAIFAKEMHDAE